MVYVRRQTRPKPRSSQPNKWPAPVSGWVSNRALADPASIEGPGAAVLDNFFPRSTGVSLRRGKELYATFEDMELPVRSLFSYRNGPIEELFGANENTIYDLTNVPFARASDLGDEEDNVFETETGDTLGWGSTDGLDVADGYTSGEWSVIQFATTGGIYLVGVNGADTGFIYDGVEFWPNVAGGMWYLPLDSQAAAFEQGETITGSISDAEAVVYRDETDRLVIQNIEEQTQIWEISYTDMTAEFTIGSTLTGDDSNASATIDNVIPDTDVLLLPYVEGTGAFVENETVTGGTSGATGVVDSVDGDTAEGSLLLTGVTGTFEDGEDLVGDSSGEAVADGDGVLRNGTIILNDLVGSFVGGETINDGSGGVAMASSAQIWVSGGPFQTGETITGSISGDAVVESTQVSAIPGVDFGDLDSSNMSFVWAYKNRLWFIELDSLTAWYLDVDSIGGEATPFPMGGIFGNGGSLLFGARWSLESGAQGGLSEQNVFVTTNGEVAIYQGASPDEASTWQLTGVYRIGSPLGKRAYLRGGGDLAIATTVGLVPLSKAISLDITALNVATVSYKIADAWTDAISMRGDTDWQAIIWPEEKLAAIAPPDLIGSSDPVMFVSNTETGAWARYTNWHALCMETFRGRLYFGSPNGEVFLGNTGGRDDGDTYSGTVIPLFQDMGNPSASKIGKMVRAITRANADVLDRVDILVDYDMTTPPAPDATPLTGTSTWGDAVWGTSEWGSAAPKRIGANWNSAGGIGFVLSPCYQVTSGSVAPIDVELISIETLHTNTELVG